MKYLLLFFMLPFLSASECGDKKKNRQDTVTVDPVAPRSNADTVNLPSCLQKMVDSLGKAEIPETPIKIDLYEYDGKKVYLVTAACCDHWNIIYSESCTPICAPSGGFTGRGDNKCPDFADRAKFIKQVWKQPGQ